MMTYKICGRRAWNDSNVRKALLVGCSLQLFQQLIGINTVTHLLFHWKFPGNSRFAGDLLLGQDPLDVRHLQRHVPDPVA